MKTTTIHALQLFLFSCLLFAGCKESPEGGKQSAQQQTQRDAVRGFTGETMGTTYAISYLPAEASTLNLSAKKLQSAIDSILYDFDDCLSTYNQASAISQINGEAGGEIDPGDCASWFNTVLAEAKLVHQASGDLFDPTIMPLLRYWGFFKEDPFQDAQSPDDDALDSLLAFIGLEEQISWEYSAGNGLQIAKTDSRAELDFNAIAKGQGVDLIAVFLQEQGLENYLVEIGGEVRTAGKNPSGLGWGIAIEKPLEGERAYMSMVRLSGESMASSGNYRRFWERDGKKYVHSLNPKSGRPEMSNLLAVSVVSGDHCMRADAYATALMVMGLNEGLPLVEKTPKLEAYFVYLDEAGEIAVARTSGFTAYEAYEVVEK